MFKQDQSTDDLPEGHATSIEWLIASIEANGERTSSSNSDVDDESPKETLVRRITGVEPRWWASVLLFTTVWLVMLYVFGFIADGMRTWPWLRFGALLGFLVTVVYVSREFGARFRVLNDRSARAHETTWAMLSGWLLIGIVSVISEPMKKLASDLQRYDTMTAVALVSWIYLYNATLKLPWDKATEQRKSAHSNWEASLRRFLASALTMQQKLLHAALAPGDKSLYHAYHRQLIEWDECYPEWRTAWQRSHSVSVIGRHEERD